MAIGAHCYLMYGGIGLPAIARRVVQFDFSGGAIDAIAINDWAHIRIAAAFRVVIFPEGEFNKCAGGVFRRVSDAIQRNALGINVVVFHGAHQQIERGIFGHSIIGFFRTSLSGEGRDESEHNERGQYSGRKPLHQFRKRENREGDKRKNE